MGLENPVLRKSHIRQVLATVYVIINFIKSYKGSISPRTRISNIKIRKKRREHPYRKLEKRGRKEEGLSFPKPKKIEDLIRCSVRYIRIRHVVAVVLFNR